MTTKYEDYLPYCLTDRQEEVLRTLIANGDVVTKAASTLGCSANSIYELLRRVKHNAVKRGYSPDHDMLRSTPEGIALRGTSTLYDADGKVKMQWVKTQADKDAQLQIMQEMFEAFKEELTPYKPRPLNYANFFSDLLAQYTISDYHIGMLAWDEENHDENWDTEIAEQLLGAWFGHAIDMTPATETAILCQLGDFLHYDGFKPLTPASGHVVDADTRYHKMVRVAIKLMRRVIDMLLDKHQHVHVICATGNHDEAGSVWLREFIHHLYQDEPRVSVDVSPSVYYAYQFGKVGLYYHHGHKKNVKNVSSVFARYFREIYGSTKKSYAHLGHMHHMDIKEDSLMVVEQHRTLASADSYASQGGYISDSSANVIVYHKNYGEVMRNTISKQLIEGLTTYDE